MVGGGGEGWLKDCRGTQGGCNEGGGMGGRLVGLQRAVRPVRASTWSAPAGGGMEEKGEAVTLEGFLQRTNVRIC